MDDPGHVPDGVIERDPSADGDRPASRLPDLREPDDTPRVRSVRREAEARAFARLLVSDIRLYREEAVYEGRAAADLATRLAEPIAIARSRFLRRFEDEAVFDRELITVLAGGDASRMGKCPR